MGQGMGHRQGAGTYTPMAGAVSHLTKQDAGSAADMGLVHALLMQHEKIERTVTQLPNGIQTVTESNDPQVAQSIKAHVASMSKRLSDGREFNLFSDTIPVLFANKDRIESTVEFTGRGAIARRTSTDGAVVAALQAHAKEVSALAQGGMAEFHRNMATLMAPGGGRAAAGAGASRTR
ncbi:MAG: hypothetical protein Q8N44_07745 [Rubrivivax sp.]|nr:hypothetical protein [Rubrivivax sp.]